ncbi:hypothetical protein P175DRAFT_0496077 [Aspergillus ochraceoroseus IBT 24754]|uniref:Alpha/beta hydrolase fold-3 domain-containing protein n=2 Tax=Aspergillus ochraceoroseus TaxID=138278 RepID=A0A2T5LNQ9_9EURO|nr:uncharacterized protein P175DRAFT_0496077 [Aspergillus ochraceoroseus IBT 24754]KKK14140.1 hypothetical protein AOCH_000819 [Aspergillus ochraceoroseus]PTU17916.1 hypothetical protein P175DRAFT_0496077 [Aspergillus ochraceoroseus IBT 24754]
MAEYARFSHINPQWERFVQSQAVLRDFRGSDDHIIQRRAAFQKLAAEGPQLRKIPGNDELDVRDFHIPARDGYEILVRSYTPRAPAADGISTYPVFVYYHGGGYTFGNIETGDDNCRLLAARNGLAVLNVDYRLAPKYIFPKGFEDAYDALRWTTKNAATFGGDLSKGFLVGGVSAGGNFAGALAYAARDEGLQPPITGLLLSIPCCLMPQAFHLVPQWKDDLRSIEQNKDSDMLDVRSYKQLIEDICQAPPDDPRISFLLHPDHSGLPTRAYFQIAGLDPIRDEAILFAKLLREHSGAETKIDMYDGLPHGFWRFQELRAAQTWHVDLYEGTKFLLEGGKGGFHVKGTENGLNEYLSGVI